MKIKQFFLLCLFPGLPLFAGNPVDDFAKSPLLENANVSLLVSDVNTRQALYQFRPKSLATPASTMKLVTTATALELLGPDFCFETKLEIDGKVSADSVLAGNLYVHGGGDPTLGSDKLGEKDFFPQWIQAVKNAGIKKITGQIIADATLFDDEGVNPRWTWEDMGNYYAAGAYGISYLDNTYKLVLQSGQEGTTPEILRTIPQIPELIFDNQLKSTSISFDSAYFYGAPHSNQRTIRGEIPARKSEFITKGDIPNPALLLAQHFNEKLIEAGFSVAQPPTDKVSDSKSRKIIYTHDSPPLEQIVTEINIHSNNHFAEHVFRYLSLLNGTVGTTNGAIHAIESFWKSKGLPVDQLIQYDGSGLAPSNVVSAQFYVDLLLYMKTKSRNSTVFYNSLPVAGETGTLSSLLKNTPLQSRIHAKSGTISRVKCYAGYIDANGRNLVFAILVNNANGSSKAVVKKMEEFLLQISAN